MDYVIGGARRVLGVYRRGVALGNAVRRTTPYRSPVARKVSDDRGVQPSGDGSAGVSVGAAGSDDAEYDGGGDVCGVKTAGSRTDDEATTEVGTRTCVCVYTYNGDC